MHNTFILNVLYFLTYSVKLFGLIISSCKMISVCHAYNVDVPNPNTNLASMLIQQKTLDRACTNVASNR